MTTLLDADQVLIHAFDDTEQALKVTGSLVPATGTQSISGEVSLVPGTVVGVTGTTTIAGIVSVSNLPATQAVSGTVSVGNFPSVQTVNVNNFPSTQAVSGSVSLVGTSPISGTVAVSNFPATQPISGSVTVLNPSASVSITGTAAVSGTVSTHQADGVFANFNIDSSTIAASGGSYLQITASTSQLTRQIAVYDTTGANLQIATGGSGSEQTAIYLGPGDSGIYPIQIPASTRLSIRSLEASAPATGANIIVRLIG